MAVTKTTISNPLAATRVSDPEANATAEAAVSGGATLIYVLEANNTDNTHVTYVKIVAAASATVGTTVPSMIFPVPAGVKISYIIGSGLSVPTNLTFWAVQEAAVGGQTAPDNSVSVELLLT